MEESPLRRFDRAADSGTLSARRKRPPGAASRPARSEPCVAPLHRAAEVAAIALVAGLGLAALARLLPAIASLRDLALACAALPIALAVADALSGLVHWAADRVLPADWPILGPAFVQPFRDHHRDPLGITRRDFVDTNGNNCLVSWPLALWAFDVAGEVEMHGVFVPALLLLSTAALALTNQIHRWAHAPVAPVWVRGLQRAGIVLSRQHHLRHHVAPQDRHFCITTGWLDGALDRLLARPEPSEPQRTRVV